MRHFGNHRVVRSLGSGAAGDVYEVEDLLTGESQALKVLRDPTPAALLRFKREFRCMRDLVHANLVGLHHLAVEGDRAWFTMDLVPGTDLIEHVRRQYIPGADDDTIPSAFDHACDVERMRECLRQLALGLGAVHAAGKVHRDLKPSNVRVRPDGRVVVLDFGLVLDQLDPLRTGAGLAIGTPAYMAPEQVSGRGVRASDWYAVGVMLYEALTGTLPFHGHVVEVLSARLQREPPPPSTIAPDVDPDLERLCVDLLRLDPRARPTADQVLARVTDGARTSASMPVVRPDRAIQRARLASIAAGVGPRGAVVVGPPAAGKRPLLREVAIEAHDRGAAVMCSRGHKRERLPFQIFDGVVDALTRHWLTASHLPVEAVILAGIFPVLRSIPVLADVDPLPTATAFTVGRALAACLATLSERGKVVVCIVDADRGDADSRHALAELFDAPDLPPVCFLFSAASLDGLALPDWIEMIEIEAPDVEADVSAA